MVEQLPSTAQLLLWRKSAKKLDDVADDLINGLGHGRQCLDDVLDVTNRLRLQADRLRNLGVLR